MSFAVAVGGATGNVGQEMLRIRDREHKLIYKIKQALDRIEEGTFGVCDSCGEDISIKRLKARPVTTQCIDCKTKEEAQEKVLGI